MVDVKATNEKLRERAKNIVKLATNADDWTVESCLKSTDYNVKLSILIILTGKPKEDAQRLLYASGGYIAKIIENNNK
jgi:N-acetylmuramic acid 6-phosphate etherase